MYKLSFLLIFILMTACTGKEFLLETDDPVHIDLMKEIEALEGEKKNMVSDNGKLQNILNNKNDLAPAVFAAGRKERLNTGVLIRKISAEINFLHIKAIKRKHLINNRIKKLGKAATTEQIALPKETTTYFQDKRLNPMKKPWIGRFKAAIQLD